MPTAATTTSRTPRTPWTAPSSRSRQKASTTPHAIPPGRTPASVGQSAAPLLTPGPRAGTTPAAPRSTSPNYFGLIVENGTGSPANSSAGNHAKQNWKSPTSSIQSRAALSPHPVPVESNPDYEEFRKQAEAYSFSLSNGTLSRYNTAHPAASSPLVTAQVMREPSDSSTPASAEVSGEGGSTDSMDIDKDEEGERPRILSPETSFRDSPAEESTLDAGKTQGRRDTLNGQLSQIDERHPRLSLPQNRVHQLSKFEHAAENRASSLPHSLSKDGPSMMSTEDLANLVTGTGSDDYLLLDLRVSQQFAQSRVKGALNLCIPTTLLKRPSFNIQRLSDSFTTEPEKAHFARWKDAAYIVLYDASSASLKDAISSVNTLKKFTSEGWKGTSYIVRGGFLAISKAMPSLLEKAAAGSMASSKNLSINSTGSVQVAGGCPMPATKSAANPFFGNIRQNMDLIGGVGQISIKLPDTMGVRGVSLLPDWLKRAVDEADKGKAAADKFLGLEKAEQQRMQAALSANVSYGTPRPDGNSGVVQIAGIEKGTKNRYKDMLPYDHSRVRLQNVPSGECDYINASHVKTRWSNRRYIAAQAPVPATFEDFWRVIWEQDVRVVVMLTAEIEGGQRKCHPYWLSDKYGPMKVKSLAEKRVSLKPLVGLGGGLKKSHAPRPPATPRRRATNPHGFEATPDASGRNVSSSSTSSSTDDAENPHLILRKLALHHTAFPFQPMREITQLQYSSWPDFGAPAHALDVLGLVEQCNAVSRMYNNDPTLSPTTSSFSPSSPPPASSLGAASRMPARKGDRPIVVHCSAGCGRTGTFCTIDSVIDMLKRQRLARDKTGSSLLQQQMQQKKKKQQQQKRQVPSKRKESLQGLKKSVPKRRGGIERGADVMMVDHDDETNNNSNNQKSIDDDDNDEEDEEEEEEEEEDSDEEESEGDSSAASAASDADDSGDERNWAWVLRDDVDLVARAVADFRLQRLSMVQTLRQYVLCYESVLEWLVKEMPERFRKDEFRRSVGC